MHTVKVYFTGDGHYGYGVYVVFPWNPEMGVRIGSSMSTDKDKFFMCIQPDSLSLEYLTRNAIMVGEYKHLTLLDIQRKIETVTGGLEFATLNRAKSAQG